MDLGIFQNKGKSWEIFLLFAGVIFYLFLFQHTIGGDGWVRYLSIMNLMTKGVFAPMLYSYVGPLFSSPLILLGYLYKEPHWWLARFNTFVLFFTCWQIARAFSQTWNAKTTRHFILLMFCATMFPKHVTDYYAEVFSACMAALAIIFFLKNRFALGAFYICISVWNTPGTSIAASLVLSYFFYRELKIRYLLVIGLLAGGLMLENFLKYQELFPKAYLTAVGDKSYLLPYSGGPGFTYPLFFGVLSVIFSYGKGLLFYMPPLVALFSRYTWKKPNLNRDFILVGTIYLVGLILLFSRWFGWSGDWFWGPRFYLFASILSCFVVTQIWNADASYKVRFIVFFATIFAIWAGLQGVMYGQDFLEDCYRRPIGVDFMCHYVPEFSPLWRPFIVQPTIVGRRVPYLIYFVLVAITVLWEPGKMLLADSKRFIWAELKEKLNFSKWRF